MSEPSQEARGVRARVSRWRATRRGTKTLKAAYAQAARDVKRMDPAVREQIGRANMTRADLQMLAGAHVDAQFRPDRYGRVSQQLGSELSARAQARPAPGPTRNPLRQVANRYSRWRNTRQGTKALKAAFTQAARDVKRTDPAVRLAIGRSTINRSDLAALASSRMDQVFRPEGRFQNAPGQQQGPQQGQQRGQQQLGAGGAGSSQMIQSRDAVRQEPQSEQMSQRIVALQQAIIENQARTMALMEENNRLQAQMRDLLQARAGEVQQQGGQNQVTPELDQTGQQQDNPNQQPQAQQPEAQQPQQPEAQQPEAQQPQQPEAQQPEAQQPQAQQPESQQPQQPEAQQPEAQQPQAQQPEGQQPQPQAQQPGGQQPEAQQPESQQPQQPEAQQPQAQQPQTQQPGAQEPRAQQPEAQQPQQPQPQAQQPGGQQPGGQRPGGQQPQAQQPEAQQPQRPEGQQGGVNSRDVKVGGPDAAGKSAKELDTKFARDIAMGGQTPLNKVSVQRSEGATKAGGDDPNRRQQRGNQTPARNNPSGKDGR